MQEGPAAVLLFLAVVVLSCCLQVHAADENVIFVSPSGNDSWTGTQATPGSADVNGTVPGPLRTLAAAVSLARTLYGPGVSKTVRVARGIYVLSSSLALTAKDNQTNFLAEDATPGATVISGGVYLPARAFVPLDTSSSLGGRVPAAARGFVKQVNLTAAPVGLTLAQLGALAPKAPGVELFFKDNVDAQAPRLARWPNYPGWVLTGEASDPPSEYLTFAYVNATSWPTYEGVWVHGFFGQNWFDERRAIASVDTGAKTITLASAVQYPFKSSMRFYYYNVIDELDAPGEYLIDRTNGVLYFYPPSPIGSDTDAVLSLLAAPLVTCNQASNVTFKGFTFEATQDTAVSMSGGSGNVIKNCTLRNVGKTAISISSGSNHLVMTSELYNMGTAGVNMGGGDRNSLTPANHMAFANHVHDYSRFILCYNPAFSASGVGVRLVNNKIHAAPHNAILLGLGNNHEIYFNEVFDVCRESSDVGAFYQGRDWTSQGTFISYNYFHDIHGVALEGVSAIYFDDENSGSTAFGNIIINMQKGVLLGGGRDNHVDNNVFVNTTSQAFYADARGLKGQRPQNNDTLYERLLNMPYTVAPWATQYPTLVHILDGSLADPYLPHQPLYNSFKHNVVCNAGAWRTITGAAQPFLDNVTADNWWVLNSSTCKAAIFPQLASTGSLEMSPDAPFVGNITFSAIPWQRIGLEGAYASLPSNLPGLKYGSIVTPQQDPADPPSSAASQPVASSLFVALALRHLFAILFS